MVVRQPTGKMLNENILYEKKEQIGRAFLCVEDIWIKNNLYNTCIREKAGAYMCVFVFNIIKTIINITIIVE